MPNYPSPFVPRVEPATSGAPLFTPAMENVRPELEYPQGPHDGREIDPIYQSDFNAEGKPATHVASRQPIITALNYDSTLAIEQEEFEVVAWARGSWVGMPPGAQMPWAERTNINIPPAVAYGSLFSLEGVG